MFVTLTAKGSVIYNKYLVKCLRLGSKYSLFLRNYRHFYPRDAMLARVLAMALFVCLCLSVCVCHKSVFY